MRTVIYGTEDIYASHSVEDGSRDAIVVNNKGEQVMVLFNEDEPDRLFDYTDWCDLQPYEELLYGRATTEAYIDACELVGLNNLEFDELHEKLAEEYLTKLKLQGAANA